MERWFLYNIEFLKYLIFKSSYKFLKRLPGTESRQLSLCQIQISSKSNIQNVEYFYIINLTHGLLKC